MTLVKHNGRTYNSFFDEFFNVAPTAWGKGLNVPPVNVHETQDGYHLEVLAAGLAKEDFKINVEKGLLTISFEQKAEAENKDYKTLRKEFTATSFKRSFSVDEKVNTDEIKAKYEAGILKVYLPKKEEVKAQPKQIDIQ